MRLIRLSRNSVNGLAPRFELGGGGLSLRAVCVVVFACMAVPSSSYGVRAADRSAIDAAFRQQLDGLAEKCEELGLKEQSERTRSWQIERDSRRSYYFLPPKVDTAKATVASSELVEQWNKKFTGIRRTHAASLWALAVAEVEGGDPVAAYALLHEVLHEDPEHAAARRVLGSRLVKSTPRPANVDNARLGWKRQKYFRHETEHFRISTNSNAKLAIELGEMLEKLHTVWRQVFFSHWASGATLRAQIAGREDVSPPLSRRHEVVLFRNRQEYLDAFQKVQSQIAKTLGIYQDRERTAFFYADDETIHASWFHEATHQLFQEVPSDIPPDAGTKHGAWALEAIALYMESLQLHDGYATLGGIDADRLQFARYHALRGDFSMSIGKLAVLGRDELQQDLNISRIYGQAAGFAHLMMEGQSRKWREPFLALIGQIYIGKAQPDSLYLLLESDAAQIDASYREFLQVSDDDLLQTQLVPQQRNLSLGMTRISDRGLTALKVASELDWLDLAFTSVTDQGIQSIRSATKLRKLFLERTRITDASLDVVATMLDLEQLDLSDCAITDVGLEKIVALTRLQELHLTNCPITDEGLRHLRGLKKLRSLELSGTGVTQDGESVRSLRKALPNWK